MKKFVTITLPALCLGSLAAAPESSGKRDESLLESLGMTVILASREAESIYDSAGTSALISARDLLDAGAVDLVDALQREPGVSIPFDFSGSDALVPYLQGGSNSINIRGLEGNRVNLMVDGIRQPEDFTARSFNGTGGPGRIYFDPAVFAQLEIYKSASSSLYGSDALAGTVEGRTEGPDTLLGDQLEGRAFTSTSTYASKNRSFNQRLAGAWGDGRNALSFVYSGRVGSALDNNSGSFPPNPAEFSSHALVLKGMHRSEEWTVTGTFDLFEQESFVELRSLLGDSLIGDIEASSNDSERSRYRVSMDAEWTPLESPIWFDSLQARAYWQDSTSYNRNPQRLVVNPGAANKSRRERLNQLSYDTEISGASLGFNKAFSFAGAEHRLNYGYDASFSTVQSALLRTDFPAAPRNLVNMAPAEVWRHGWYLSDRISFGEREQWVVTPSLRVEGYQVTPDNTEDFLNLTSFPLFDEFGRFVGTESVEAQPYDNLALAPGMKLQYWVQDDLNVYYTWAQGIRNPSAEELMAVFQHEDDFITLPNPALAEERSSSHEVGLQFDDRTVSGQISAYWNHYDGFIESGVPTGEILDGRQVLRTVNREEAEIYGVEIRGDWQLGQSHSALDGFHLGVSGAWSAGRTRDPGGDWQPLNTVEPWKASAWLAYDSPEQNWGSSLTATYFAAKDPADIAGDLEPSPDYLLVDLTAYYRFSDQVLLRGGLTNLLDEEFTLWTRANRGSGHNGGGTTRRDQQPGLNGFLALELSF